MFARPFRRAGLGALVMATSASFLLGPSLPAAAQADPFRDLPIDAPCSACSYDDAPRAYVDSDLDGLLDLDEPGYGADAFIADSDSDGLLDGDEVYRYGTNPTTADTDGDGFADGVEIQNGTDPFLWDDDLNPDTDGDGLRDYDEAIYGASPYVVDSDGDRLGDGNEVFVYGTLPSSVDTDDDGAYDGHEIGVCTDPLDPSDFPSSYNNTPCRDSPH
jgi:hypothetical protein